MKKRENKVAVVTGASTGIGRAVAVELAKERAKVFLVARSKKGLEETKKLINQVGGEAEIIVADLSNYNSIKNLIRKVKKEVKKIDILANIAGVWHSDDKYYFDTEFTDFTDEVIISSLDVGLKASMLLAKAFVALMEKGGVIINTSGSFSKNEVGCLPDLVTKKALEIFTEQLALEVKDKGIRVNAIRPWYVWTEAVQKFFPNTKDEAMLPVEVAKKVVELCSSKTSGKIIDIKRKK